MAGSLKMHDDEIEVPLELVGRLVAAQFPDWADLELELLLPWGTDNALFRLGDDKLVRLPRTERVVGQIEKDVSWLPRLAPQLPVAIPEVLATGAPSADYPWTWGIYRWLEGETPPRRPPRRGRRRRRRPGALPGARCARSSAAGAPPRSSRGVPLATRDESTRRSIADLDGRVDTSDAATDLGGGVATPRLARAADVDPRRPHAGEPDRPRRTAVGGDRLVARLRRRPGLRPDGRVDVPRRRQPRRRSVRPSRSTTRPGRVAAAGRSRARWARCRTTGRRTRRSSRTRGARSPRSSPTRADPVYAEVAA